MGHAVDVAVKDGRDVRERRHGGLRARRREERSGGKHKRLSDSAIDALHDECKRNEEKW